MCQLIEFAKTVRLSHTLFALPFALGTAMLAEPPCPEWRALALLLACMATARTAAMGMNRVADAALDARNPRTADRAIPAGRLSRRAALAMSLASGAAFIALAWGFYYLHDDIWPRNWWPGVLAPVFLAILFGYSWTKRFTFLAHWVLGLCLGLAPVGVWVALRGEISLVPVLIGAAVMFWTAGFDIFYAFQDIEVDRREGLHSVPARFGPKAARGAAVCCHVWTVALLSVVVAEYSRTPGNVQLLVSMAVLLVIAAALVVQHLRARRASAQQIGAMFFPLNAFVSIMWLAGVTADVLFSRQIFMWLSGL
jgi:4-hydroxybenzoate polyprenyltransferase